MLFSSSTLKNIDMFSRILKKQAKKFDTLQNDRERDTDREREREREKQRIITQTGHLSKRFLDVVGPLAGLTEHTHATIADRAYVRWGRKCNARTLLPLDVP